MNIMQIRPLVSVGGTTPSPHGRVKSMILTVLCAIFALLLAVAGILGWTRHFPGNSFIGITTAGTRKSKEAWDRAHFAAGPFWLIGALAFLFATLFSYRGSWILAIIGALIGLVFLALGVGSGARFSALYDDSSEPSQDPSPSSPGSSATETPAEVDAPVQVDLDAVRRAAQSRAAQSRAAESRAAEPQQSPRFNDH